MAQFAVHRNRGASGEEFPFLLDVQNDLLSTLDTRVVVPLRRAGSPMLPSMGRLTPALPYEGESYLLMVPLMAGVALRDIGEEVGDLREHRDAILAALDLLIVGF